LGIFGFTTDMADVLTFKENADSLLEGLCKTDGPLRIKDTAHARGHRHVVFDRVMVPQVGTMGGQIVHIATVFVCGHLATPAVRIELVVAHFGREADSKVTAALVGKVQIESCALRKPPRCASRDFSHDIDRKTSLRGMQKIKVAEVGDLDPALSFFAQ
jgi:hypothetical protein